MSSEYLREYSKKFETTLTVYSGAWGKLIHEKKIEVENLVTLSLLLPQEVSANLAHVEPEDLTTAAAAFLLLFSNCVT